MKNEQELHSSVKFDRDDLDIPLRRYDTEAELLCS